LKEELIKIAISEIENPTFETTKQYLEVHSVELKNGKPKIERIDYESFDTTNAVYFPIQNELFFLVVYLNKEDNEINGIGTENGHKVYLTATSEYLTYKELSELTKLRPLTGWSKNDLRKNGKSKYTFSRISFEPTKSQAYELEQKLKILLTELEKDKNGIKKLTEKAETYISVCSNLYVDGNKGIVFDEEIIKRMSELNLGIGIDQYVFGNELNNI
tara:strand:- start:60798 stop:61448 length:651 start_codon:yes stop_codon:yes gene_type:complete